MTRVPVSIRERSEEMVVLERARMGPQDMLPIEERKKFVVWPIGVVKDDGR